MSALPPMSQRTWTWPQKVNIFGSFHVNIIITALVMLVIAIASPTDTKRSLSCFSYFLELPSVSPPSNEAEEMAIDGELL